jgi:RND family efflux transporter MFP subunit
MTSRKLSVALIVVALAAGPACKKAESKEGSLPPATGPGAPPQPKLPTIEKNAPLPTAQTGSDRTVGTVYPLDEAKIGPKSSGVVTKIFVAEGQAVKKGAPLFQLDARQIALQRDQAQAALKAATVDSRAADVEFQRMKSLFDAKAINQVQLEQAQERLEIAKVRVEQAQVALAQANQALADATVRSPMNGVVTKKLVSEGEMATMMPPTVVLIVQDQSKLELRFRMPEKALAQLKVGQKLRAKFASLNVEREVEIVRLSPAIDPISRTVEVFAQLPNSDSALKPGMLADVEMVP